MYSLHKVMGHQISPLDIISRVKGVKGFFHLYCNYSFSICLGCFKIKTIKREKEKYCHLLQPQVFKIAFISNRNDHSSSLFLSSILNSGYGYFYLSVY